MGKITGIVKYLILGVIKVYQYAFSPLLGHCCRFEPSCATYAFTAVQTHSIFYAFYLMIKRLLRCHPWCQGGMDLVPEKKPHVDLYV